MWAMGERTSTIAQGEREERKRRTGKLTDIECFAAVLHDAERGGEQRLKGLLPCNPALLRILEDDEDARHPRVLFGDNPQNVDRHAAGEALEALCQDDSGERATTALGLRTFARERVDTRKGRWAAGGVC